jgi:Zn-dependent protease with chaperone function
VTLFSTDRASFRAIVLHELAHLRNADVNKTYFAIATWWAFVIVALVPFTAFDIISAARFGEDRYLFLNDAWRVLVMAVLVFLVLRATLRAREFYADVRAAIWENSADPLLRVLNRLEMPKKRWQRVTHVHPDPRERGRTLNETDRLFRMGLWDALGFGLAIGIAAPNVLALVKSLLLFAVSDSLLRHT